MSFITAPIERIDEVIGTIAKKYIEVVAGPVEVVTVSAGVLIVIVMTVNHFLQFKPIDYRIYLPIMVKIVIIQLIISSWANYSFISNILMDVPAELAGGLIEIAYALPGDSLNSIYTALEIALSAVFATGVSLVAATTQYTSGFVVLSQLIFGIGITAVGTVLSVIVGSKIAFALGIALGPIFIPFMLHSSTNNFFLGWLKFTISAAFVPVIFSGVLSIIVTAVLPINSGITFSLSDSLSAILGSVMLLICAFTVVKQVPVMVSSLFGSLSPVAGAITGAAVGTAVSNAHQSYGKVKNADENLKMAKEHMKNVSDQTGVESKLGLMERTELMAKSFAMSNHQQMSQRDSSRVDGMDDILSRAEKRAKRKQLDQERPWERVPTTPTEIGNASSTHVAGDEPNNAVPPSTSATTAESAATVDEVQSNDNGDDENSKKENTETKPQNFSGDQSALTPKSKDKLSDEKVKETTNPSTPGTSGVPSSGARQFSERSDPKPASTVEDSSNSSSESNTTPKRNEPQPQSSCSGQLASSSESKDRSSVPNPSTSGTAGVPSSGARQSSERSDPKPASTAEASSDSNSESNPAPKKSATKPESSSSAETTSVSPSEDKSSDDDADKKEKRKRNSKPTPRPKPTVFREKYYGSRGTSSTDDRIARANNKPKSG